MCIVFTCKGCGRYSDDFNVAGQAWMHDFGKHGYCMVCDPIPEGWTYQPKPWLPVIDDTPDELKWMDDPSIRLED